jgi:hypothetical protein
MSVVSFLFSILYSLTIGISDVHYVYLKYFLGIFKLLSISSLSFRQIF